MHDLLANRPRGAQPVTTHALAGQPAPVDVLIDVVELQDAYYRPPPDPRDARHAVAFGTSGHRGTSLDGTFTESHILAITQAICDYRAGEGITGPLFLGKDTHALSAPAQRTALEVLAGNGVEVVIQRDDGVTPTPVISHAILAHNRARRARRADGIVITPSHNPPADGGFKYNPPHGGPAETDVTSRDPGSGQRPPPRRQRRSPATPLREGDPRPDDAPGRLRRPLRGGPRQRRSTWTRSAPPA